MVAQVLFVALLFAVMGTLGWIIAARSGHLRDTEIVKLDLPDDYPTGIESTPAAADQ
jgi:hypothetical protein